MKNKAFTLIELLAVIVVLGIIMLIAVTAVSNVINNSKTNSFKTSAMMVAKQIRNEVLPMGYTNNQTIDCLNGNYGLNPNNYDYCSANISIINDDTKVYVDLVGKGNFNGLSVVGATQGSATTTTNATYQSLKNVLLAPANIKGNVAYGDPGSITGGLYQWGTKYIYRGGISRTGASLTTGNYGSDTVSTATDIANYIKVPWENNSTACNNTYSNNPCWRIISVNADGSITISRDRVESNQAFDNTYNTAAGAAYGYNDFLENVPTSGHPEEYRATSLMYNKLYGTNGYQNTTLKNYFSILNTIDVCLNKTSSYAGINSTTYSTTTAVTDTCNVVGKPSTIQVDSLKNQYVRLPYQEEYINVSLETACTNGAQYQCRNQNFMYSIQNYWSLNGSTSNTWTVRYFDDFGPVTSINASTSSYGVRPVVILKSSVLISGGTGTVLNPYIIKT